MVSTGFESGELKVQTYLRVHLESYLMIVKRCYDWRNSRRPAFVLMIISCKTNLTKKNATLDNETLLFWPS